MSAHCTLEVLSSYVDRELDAGETDVVREHVDGCAECRRRLLSLRGVVGQLQRLEQVAAPSALGFQVERRLRLEGERRPLPGRIEDGLDRFTRQPVLAPLFAIVIAFGAILYLFSLGVARNESTTTRVVVGRPAPSDGSATRESQLGEEGSGLEKPSPGEEARVTGSGGTGAVIERAGHRFRRRGDEWVEEGLDEELPAEVIDLGKGDRLPPGLEVLQTCPGTYRLRHEGRVVEVVVPG